MQPLRYTVRLSAPAVRSPRLTALQRPLHAPECKIASKRACCWYRSGVNADRSFVRGPCRHSTIQSPRIGWCGLTHEDRARAPGKICCLPQMNFTRFPVESRGDKEIYIDIVCVVVIDRVVQLRKFFQRGTGAAAERLILCAGRFLCPRDMERKYALCPVSGSIVPIR